MLLSTSPQVIIIIPATPLQTEQISVGNLGTLPVLTKSMNTGMKNPIAKAKQMIASTPKKNMGRYSRNERNMVKITLKPSEKVLSLDLLPEIEKGG